MLNEHSNGAGITAESQRSERHSATSQQSSGEEEMRKLPSSEAERARKLALLGHEIG